MDIVQIIAKKIKGSLSDKEQEYLDLWINESEENEALYNRILNSGASEGISALANLDEKLEWQKVLEKSSTIESKNNKNLQLRSILKYAAVFIGVVGLGYGYWEFNLLDRKTVETEDSITLQLENGEMRTISTEVDQTIVNAKGKVLGQQKRDRLDYSNPTKTSKLVYNTLTVPYGKRFSVVLSDSTVVHLNAGSSLKYPVRFMVHQDRKVFLTGEGYFKVTTDREHPFVVTSDNMDVRVLGTEFNVSAYPEDREINTVLVEGSVSLYRTKDKYDSKNANVLKPGYKAAWDRFYEKIDLEQVDTDIYTEWINGKLVIKEMPFKNIARKLERHYNVSIENTYGNLNNQVFTATFDVETIEEVLKIFIQETPFEFEIEGKKITIYNPETKN